MPHVATCERQCRDYGLDADKTGQTVFVCIANKLSAWISKGDSHSAGYAYASEEGNKLDVTATATAVHDDTCFKIQFYSTGSAARDLQIMQDRKAVPSLYLRLPIRLAVLVISGHCTHSSQPSPATLIKQEFSPNIIYMLAQSGCIHERFEKAAVVS